MAILVLGFGSAIIWRGNLVLLMLLPASEFLGFVDPMKIAVRGMFDIHALILLIIIGSVALSIFRIKDFFLAELFRPIFLFFLFWLYGVFNPLLSGNSSLFYSIKSSKEFLTVFSFVAILLFLRTKKDVDFGWKCLIGLGLYYSVLEISGQFIGPLLKEKMSYHMRVEEGFFWKIYAPLWPVILLALFSSYYNSALKLSRPFVKLSVSAVGLLLTFFRSYLLAALVALPVVLFINGQGLVRTFSRATLLFFSICFCLLLIGAVTFSMGGKFASVDRIADKFFVSAVKELATQTGGALKGRENVTVAKRKLLREESIAGYGFIDKDSKFGKKISKIIRGDNLGFIDMGVLDVPIKFGYVGFCLLLLNVIYIIYLLRKMALSSESDEFKVRCMSVAAMIITFILVLPVHAPFTYSYGLLPLGISLGLIEKERILLAEESQAAL